MCLQIEWKREFFSNLTAKVVIVIDRATYHMELTENTFPVPSNSTKKKNLQNGCLREKMVHKNTNQLMIFKP